MHCSQGFYSFVQRESAKKILLQPPKSFHDWKQKFFFIKVRVIPMRMTFRGKEDVPTETIQTHVDENWYKDLKDVLSIVLPKKALFGPSMSLKWKMSREEKPVYMEDGKNKIGRRWELWYHHIVRNFVLPRDDDLSAQLAAGAGKFLSQCLLFAVSVRLNKLVSCDFIVGELSNLGIGPEKKRRAPTTTAASKKSDAEKAQPSKAKNVGGEKKVIRRPKSEPKDTFDIPSSNPDDPIDWESSPERLLRKKVGKRKQGDAEVEGQPEKKVRRKKITRRGNLDAFISELGKSLARGVVNVDAGNPQTPELVARDSEKGKTAEEIPATTSPSVASGSMP
ncbi:hypothetical protein Hanom_Chr04g00359781 [Helianthus anomalus]